jgi:hypothetical protein
VLSVGKWNSGGVAASVICVLPVFEVLRLVRFGGLTLLLWLYCLRNNFLLFLGSPYIIKKGHGR